MAAGSLLGASSAEVNSKYSFGSKGGSSSTASSGKSSGAGYIGMINNILSQNTKWIGEMASAQGKYENSMMKVYNTRLKSWGTAMTEKGVDMELAWATKELKKGQETFYGNQRAAYGKSGLAFDGTPAEVMIASMASFEKDIIATELSAEMQKNQLKLEGRVSDISANYQAKMARIQRRTEMATSTINRFTKI